jgi:hypothetical protein
MTGASAAKVWSSATNFSSAMAYSSAWTAMGADRAKVSTAMNPEMTVRDRWVVDMVVSFGFCRVNRDSGRHGTVAT